MPKVFFILAIVLAALALTLVCCNTESVPVAFGSWKTTEPASLLVIEAYALGAFTAACAFLMRRKETKVEQKKLEWKTEDAKLQTEIQSDKVHQLEMQVKTLEAALDKALKRGKS